MVRVEAEGGTGAGRRRAELRMFHKDGYLFTAIPVAAFLLQYLEGTARKPGLWMMGHLADPERLLADMERMGVLLGGDLRG